MKKVICLAVIISVLFSMLIFPSVSVNAAVRMPYANNFDDYKQRGSGPSGWTTWIQTGQNIEGVPNPDGVDANDYVLKLSCETTSANQVYMYLSGALPQGKIQFKIDFYFENLEMTRELIGLTTEEGQDNNMITLRDGKLNIRSGPILDVPEKKWIRLDAIYNTETGELTVDVDGKKHSGNSYVRGPLNRVKITHNGIEGKIGATYVNNLEIIPLEPEKSLAGEEGEEEELAGDVDYNALIEERLKSSVALFVGGRKAYLNNEYVFIDEDYSVFPQIIDGAVMVPVRFIAQAFNCDIQWNEASNSVQVKSENKTIIIPVGENEIKVNGKTVKTEVSAQVINGRTFLPLKVISQALGKKIFQDEMGLVVIGNNDKVLDSTKDKKLITELLKNIIFERPSIEDVRSRFYSNGKAEQHPRIYADEEDFERVRKLIKDDPTIAEWFERYTKQAEAFYQTQTIYWGPLDDLGRTPTGWEMNRRFPALAFMYKVTGDKKWFDRLILDMDAAAAFETWNPGHFLDVAEGTVAMAIGYDWLYHDLTEEQREKYRTAIYELGLYPGLEVYRGEVTGPWNRAAWVNVDNNWNMVTNFGMIIGALAIAEHNEEAFEVLASAIKSNESSIIYYEPDGAWDEGPSYWGYGTGAMVNYMNALETVLGTAYGLPDYPGILKTGYYPPYVSGPAGVFNYHDSDAGKTMSSSLLWWFAKKTDDPFLAGYRYNSVTSGVADPSSSDFLGYNPELCDTNVNLPLDKYFRKDELASFRSLWDDENALYVGFTGGYNAANHGNLDAGNFVLDAMGERWADELAKDSYTLPGYFSAGENIKAARYTFYRLRAEGQNTLIINPRETADQSPAAFIRMSDFQSKEKGGYAVADMTDAFFGEVKEAKRGVWLFDNRTKVLIQDEIKSSKINKIWWFMHTRTNVTVADDGKSAIMEKNGKHLKVVLASPSSAKLKLMPAQPLPSSPIVVGQNQNKDLRKLGIEVKNARDTTISVYFIPIYDKEDAEVELPEIIPISEWEIEDGENDLATLSEITVNGEKIKDFTPKKLMYDIMLPSDVKDGEIPSVSAKGEGTIKVETVPYLPGMIKIHVKADGKKDNTYYLNVKIIQRPGEIRVPEGVVKLDAVGVTASGNDGNVEANVIDGKLDTRWSYEGAGEWITLDLGSAKTMTHIAMAFYNGHTRATVFDIETSNDNNKWTNVYSGASNGESSDPELFKIKETKARYIRIVGQGNSSNNWNSITEIWPYGPK